VLDTIGSPYMQRNLDSLGTEGCLVQVAFGRGSMAQVAAQGKGGMDGPTTDANPVNMMRLMLKRLHWTGATLRSRNAKDKAGIVQRALAAMHAPVARCATAIAGDHLLATGWGRLNHHAVETHLDLRRKVDTSRAPDVKGVHFRPIQPEWPLAADFTVPLTARFRLEDVEEAHTHLNHPLTWGKTVLRVCDDVIEMAEERLRV